MNYNCPDSSCSFSQVKLSELEAEDLEKNCPKCKKPLTAKKTILSKETNNTIEIEEYNKLTEEEKEKYYFKYDNKNYLNVYNDSEINWLFR